MLFKRFYQLTQIEMYVSQDKDPRFDLFINTILCTTLLANQNHQYNFLLLPKPTSSPFNIQPK